MKRFWSCIHPASVHSLLSHRQLKALIKEAKKTVKLAPSMYFNYFRCCLLIYCRIDRHPCSSSRCKRSGRLHSRKNLRTFCTYLQLERMGRWRWGKFCTGFFKVQHEFKFGKSLVETWKTCNPGRFICNFTCILMNYKKNMEVYIYLRL